MTKEQLLTILNKLPDGTEVYVRDRDNAWPAKARLFHYGGKLQEILYLETSAGNHLNFPEGYRGVTEVSVEEFLKQKQGI